MHTNDHCRQKIAGISLLSALNVLDLVGESGEQTRQAVSLLYQDKDRPKGEPDYDLRLAEWLVEKWRRNS